MSNGLVRTIRLGQDKIEVETSPHEPNREVDRNGVLYLLLTGRGGDRLTAVYPTAPFWLNTEFYSIFGIIRWSAFIMATPGNISLVVRPPALEGPDTPKTIFYGDFYSNKRLGTHRRIRTLQRSREDTEERLRNAKGEHQDVENIIKSHEAYSEIFNARYNTLSRAIEEHTTSKERLTEMIQNDERYLHHLESWPKPFPDHYLSVKSERGTINIGVVDPYAFVDIAEGQKVSMSPPDYTPQLIKRRIGVETIEGAVNIRYRSLEVG